MKLKQVRYHILRDFQGHVGSDVAAADPKMKAEQFSNSIAFVSLNEPA